MNQKLKKKDRLCELKCKLIEGNKVQNRHGINLNVDASVKASYMWKRI